MKSRLAIALLGLLLPACQSSIPFYTKPVHEPEWFKAKEAEASAKGYPSAQAIPPNPTNLPTAAQMKAELQAVEQAGEKVRHDERAALSTAQPRQPKAFVEKALEKNTVPPLIDDETRQEDEAKPGK